MKNLKNESKERMIEMIVGDKLNCYEHFSTTHLIYEDTDIEDILYEIRKELENIVSDLEKRNLEIEKEKQRLSKLPTHEIAEMGEERGLWKQKEKQKRLI